MLDHRSTSSATMGDNGILSLIEAIGPHLTIGEPSSLYRFDILSYLGPNIRTVHHRLEYAKTPVFLLENPKGRHSRQQ